METFIFIVIIFALLHFIYEAIILPSILLNIKYKFNKIKDNVINMVIEDKNKINPLDFNLTVLNIEYTSKSIGEVSFVQIIKGFFFVKNNPKIAKKYDGLEKKHLLSNPKLKEINDKSNNYIVYALLANSFMLILYFLPIIILALILIAVFGKSRKTFKLIKNSFDMETNLEEISENGYCVDNRYCL